MADDSTGVHQIGRGRQKRLDGRRLIPPPPPTVGDCRHGPFRPPQSRFLAKYPRLPAISTQFEPQAAVYPPGCRLSRPTGFRSVASTPGEHPELHPSHAHGSLFWARGIGLCPMTGPECRLDRGRLFFVAPLSGFENATLHGLPSAGGLSHSCI